MRRNTRSQARHCHQNFLVHEGGVQGRRVDNVKITVLEDLPDGVCFWGAISPKEVLPATPIDAQMSVCVSLKIFEPTTSWTICTRLTTSSSGGRIFSDRSRENMVALTGKAEPVFFEKEALPTTNVSPGWECHAWQPQRDSLQSQSVIAARGGTSMSA